MPHRCTIAILALAGTTPAQLQTYVNPAANATVEGNQRISFPFGGRAAMRLQQICGLNGLPATGPLLQVAFRRDNDVAVGSRDYVGWNPTFDLSLSSSPRSTLTMSRIFSENVGPDVRLVHRGTLSWPAQVKRLPGPTPFAYTVPLLTPFPYLSNGDLLLDIVQTSSDNSNVLCFLDADSSPLGTVAKLQGSGCPGTSNAVTIHDNWGPGATARITLTRATATTVSILSLGASGSRWGTIPLPIDLAPLGAPGCKIYNDNVSWLPGMTTALGEWDVWFRIPEIPELGGVSVFTQFYQPRDPGANNRAGLTTSEGYEVTIAVPMKGVPAQSVSYSSSPTDTTAAVLQLGYGHVVEFGHR